MLQTCRGLLGMSYVGIKTYEKLVRHRMVRDMVEAGQGLALPVRHSIIQLERSVMLYYSILFLVIALIAAFLGFAGVAGAAAGIAKILFFLFLILFVVSLLFGRRRVP